VVSPIRHLFRSRSRISERVVGEPLEFGARTIQPVVRISGWRGAGSDVSGGSAGIRLRVGPTEVIVLEGNGREYRVPTPDNTRLILWALASVALVVAVASQVMVRVLR
jgi:hypothetical protein